jgi:hypothetical protein
MKSFAIACALLLFAASASAAEPVAKSTLASMGLGNMQQLSDTDGLAVRGKGAWTSVWGGSVANWYGGQSATNNYQGGSSWYGKPSGSTGNSFSFAGKVSVNAVADPTGFGVQAHLSGGFAGGFASARAW